MVDENSLALTDIPFGGSDGQREEGRENWREGRHTNTGSTPPHHHFSFISEREYTPLLASVFTL